MEEQDIIIDQSELDDFQVQLLQKRALAGAGNNNGAGGRSMIVSGCAGSGKTILALWKTKEIKNLGFSYIFIVFTRALHQYMSKAIQYIGLDDERFMYHYKWKEKGCPSADFIIVDEIQDFTREEISQFKKASKKAFLFWGDSAQTIFRNLKPTQDILSIAAEAGIHPETLVFNHRLPKKIARLAAHMQCDEDLVRRCTKEGEELPRILRFSSLEEQLDAAMQQINNRQITKAAILFPEKSILQKAYDYLKSNGHQIEAHLRDQSNLGYKVSDMNFSSDNPKLLTYHSAKGLQFEAVFLPECNPHERMGIEPLYVAITCSYRHLFVMYSTQLSRYFDAVPKDLYLTTLDSEKVAL